MKLTIQILITLIAPYIIWLPLFCMLNGLDVVNWKGPVQYMYSVFHIGSMIGFGCMFYLSGSK